MILLVIEHQKISDNGKILILPVGRRQIQTLSIAIYEFLFPTPPTLDDAIMKEKNLGSGNSRTGSIMITKKKC